MASKKKCKCLGGSNGSDHKISHTKLDISPWKVVVIISISKKVLSILMEN